MKGIILSGGLGSRLSPMTRSSSKQLLPVYDKPMIYYPLSTLMLGGIREILLISTKEALPLYENLLGDGSQLGIKISYKLQKKPEGLAQAFLLGEEFIGNSCVSLILGDNLFYGAGFGQTLSQYSKNHTGARIFSYYVNTPEDYGVIKENEEGEIEEIIEKPKVSPSNYAVTGLYYYDNKVVEYAKTLKASPRGELEISDLNNIYLRASELKVTKLGRGIAWLDTGTPQNLLQASNFVYTIEERQGLKIACLEEIAYIMGYIDFNQLKDLAEAYAKSSYGDYLRSLVKKESQESVKNHIREQKFLGTEVFQ